MLSNPAGTIANLRVEVFKKIDDIKQKGASILLVEQSTAIAAEYADIIYVLEDGKIVFSGTREEAFDNQNIREVFLKDKKIRHCFFGAYQGEIANCVSA